MNLDNIFVAAKAASRKLNSINDETINIVLNEAASALIANAEELIKANAEDLSRMKADDPKRDRLMLTPERIHAIATDMRNVALLPSPRRIIDSRTRPNGLQITRVAVPMGVVGVIFEARPNVTADVFSLCLKSGNACVLKGGHEAEASNQAIVNIIREVLVSFDLDGAVLTLLPSTREAGEAMMHARGNVDVIIPRGSRQLIDSVRKNATVPVIETGAGVCHCYVDASADTLMAAKIVNNAKTRRVSVCNALDCMLINVDKINHLPEICTPLASHNVIIYADDRAFDVLSDNYPSALLCKASPEDYGREFLGYAMAVKTVENLEQAIDHINCYGTGHSESIVTSNEQNAATFRLNVDAACIYVNAPTSFTDGAQFGLGAEIGISTQKLHARGPMALAELMTYKWLIDGNGQTRQ